MHVLDHEVPRLPRHVKPFGIRIDIVVEERVHPDASALIPDIFAIVLDGSVIVQVTHEPASLLIVTSVLPEGQVFVKELPAVVGRHFLEGQPRDPIGSVPPDTPARMRKRPDKQPPERTSSRFTCERNAP